MPWPPGRPCSHSIRESPRRHGGSFPVDSLEPSLPRRRPMRRGPTSALALCLLLSACSPAPAAAPPAVPRVTPVPDSVRNARKLDPFYQKYTDYNGLPVLSSSKVSDRALL